MYIILRRKIFGRVIGDLRRIMDTGRDFERPEVRCNVLGDEKEVFEAKS